MDFFRISQFESYFVTHIYASIFFAEDACIVSKHLNIMQAL